jgi:2-polyprenyl-6-hydroxyphenyl methylase/3-demethylubiquinone-9 3-methyltransferase
VTGDLRAAASHFRFGENWAGFARAIDEERLALAVQSLARILPADLLSERTMLDIGSGSGLSAVAALRLGARHVTAIDIDRDSVATTAATLARFAAPASFTVREASILELPAGGGYDIVHSWGVLHHTGDLPAALQAAARHVAPGGRLVLSLYRRTPLDRLWIAEKRLYTHGPRWLPPVIRSLFKGAYLAAIAVTGRNPIRYVHEYPRERGMSWSHDVHDWLGGYPYEPIDTAELVARLGPLGFVSEQLIERPVRARGLFGAPCNEYRLARKAAA